MESLRFCFISADENVQLVSRAPKYNNLKIISTPTQFNIGTSTHGLNIFNTSLVFNVCEPFRKHYNFDFRILLSTYEKV